MHPACGDTRPSLLNRLRDRGDHAGWVSFFERYWRLVYGFSRRCGLSSVDAEDVLQDVFVELFKTMPQFEYARERGRFRAYLRTVTHRKIIDHQRRQVRRSRLVELDPGCDLADSGSSAGTQAWEDGCRQSVLLAALQRVAQEVEPKTYQAFQLCALEAQSPRQVASLLGLSVAAVYMARSRVTRRIRELCADEV